MGVVTYIAIAILVVGYFVAKKWGDKEVEPGLLEAEGMEGGDMESANQWLLVKKKYSLSIKVLVNCSKGHSLYRLDVLLSLCVESALFVQKVDLYKYVHWLSKSPLGQFCHLLESYQEPNMSDNSGQFSNNTRPRRKVEDQNRPNRQLTSKKEEENEMAKYLIGNP